ncbi:MAG TPA: carboxypeptidase-like regulatory domain-containing protein [Saprospiraceae bacterium]|nr:carboxypeptidase-like regulatory domain-containing protein [Saprospiraceae bacterium]
MNLFRARKMLILLFMYCAGLCYAQDAGFDSFISRISKQYHVDLALAPELLPALDSIRNSGLENTNIEDLLHQLLDGTNISYQIVDGNKLMLRRESTYVHTAGMFEVKGIIVDAEDGLPLPYAAVTVKGSNHGAFTDENGNFTLSVNDSLGNILVSYLGFNTMTIPVQSLLHTTQPVLLKAGAFPLKQVIIVVPYQQMTVNQDGQSIDLRGYQFFSADQLLNGNAEQLINSITGYTHFSSDQGIRLRGSDAENTLVVMDGLPVYDPYHFYNIFSAFNGHYFSSVKLYKNNMPVEYGGRIDGLINIDSDHDAPGSRLILDTDLLLSSFSADWGISDKVRLTAGARVSHTGVINEALGDSSVSNFSNGPGRFQDESEWTSTQQPTFNFYDMNAGMRAAIGHRSNLQLSYFKNKDNLSTFTSTDLETTEDHGHEVIIIKQKIKSRDMWQNGGGAFAFETPFLQKATFNLNGFISSFDKSSTFSSWYDEFKHNKHRISKDTSLQNSHLNTGGLKAFIAKDLNGEESYKFGIDVQRHQIDLRATENNKPYLFAAQHEIESTLFGEYKFSGLKNLEWTLGGRLTHLQSTSSLYVQPHLLINYFANDHLTFKTSYSKNIQAIQQITLENRYGREIDFPALSQPDEGYPVLKSDKYMAGAGFNTSHLSMDVEFYYKKLDGLVNVRAPNPNPSFHGPSEPDDFYRLYTGDGWTAGMDLLLAFKQKNFEGTMYYTLSKISERFDKLFNGNPFSPEEDRRHQLKISANYKIKKFTVNSLLTYKTKAPYLSLIKIDGHGGAGMGDPDNSFKYLPAYFSLDLGLDYSFTIYHQPAQIGISLINATNHVNISDFEHTGLVTRDEGPGGGGSPIYLTQQTELLGRTFNVHARVLIH